MLARGLGSNTGHEASKQAFGPHLDSLYLKTPIIPRFILHSKNLFNVSEIRVFYQLYVIA